MQRLALLELSRSQLLSASEILRVDKLSAEIKDDNEYLREVERRLQLAVQVLSAPTVWDELLERLEDEPYAAAAERPSQFTQPLHGGRPSVTVNKWDIQAESDAWLQSQKPSLEKVGGCAGLLLHSVSEVLAVTGVLPTISQKQSEDYSRRGEFVYPHRDLSVRPSQSCCRGPGAEGKVQYFLR